MTAVQIFKNSFVNVLRGAIRTNLDKYLHEGVWTTQMSSESARQMRTSIEVSETIQLDPPEDGSLKDAENAIRFHSALRQLTPLQARDPRLWTIMTHQEYWPYMRLRWPVEKHISDREKAMRFVESRYFVAQSQSRALLRNGIARLWWTAQLSYDASRENPYELTEVLFSTLDITQQILERGMGRATNIIKGFLGFLLRNKALLLAGGDVNRVRIRRLAKYLNMHGGVCVLDVLGEGEVMDFLDKELERTLKDESPADI